uniref:ATP-dependent Clp protease proteolytic subunit n=1 Tax=Acacia murrayana TaxID=334160 RepID=A0A1D0CI80_9FABA|nr:clpP1 [Acacia murrayana]CUR04825.1 clpP1 [Acacia murrayana]
MPIGIPKVPFQGPEDDDAAWIDLYNRLYRQRALFLGQRVDSLITNQIIGIMLYLTIEDPKKKMELFINSPGGSITSGIAIYDLMQVLEPEVHTICIGEAASMAAFVLLGGEITKRMAFPHARVMIHQAIADLRPKTKTLDYISELNEVITLYHMIVNLYAQRTGKPAWVIREDMARDTFMSAEEAQAHGIIDLIVTDEE